MNLPRPSANVAEYKRIMESGFARFPERKQNYDKFVKAHGGGPSERADYMPVKMDYEVSSLCNFRCRMCLMAEISDHRPPQMSFADYKKSLDEQCGLIEVKLQGIGEPLLNKDFFDMVRETVSRDIWARTTTNGSLLHLNDNYKRMIDEKIGEIQVSIDGATKETFEKIRTGSNFERVVENVKKMNEYAKSKGEGWRSSCWMLVQEDNFHEIYQLLDLAEYMNFSRVTYSLTVSDWGGQDNWTEINDKKDVSNRFTEEMGHKLIELGKSKGINVTFWEGKDKYVFDEKKDKICQWLFSRAYISGGMKIVPCCVICTAEKSELGEALNFADYWNAEPYRALRRMHLSGNIPPMCRNCY